MRAGIYSRKSNDDGLRASVARQLEQARIYIEAKGWDLCENHVYVDDGVSGAEFVNRDGLSRLMNAAASKPRPFDVLVTADADRIGRLGPRSALVFLNLYEAGIRIFYYLTDEEQRFASALDRAMLTLSGFGGEFEREKAKLRTRDALLTRARRGHVTGGVVFGYRNVPVYAGTDSSGNQIRCHVDREPHPAEAATVLEIFRAYADGHGLRSIARALNADPAMAELSRRYFAGRRVAPPRKGTGSWDPSAINAMLRNELYRGTLTWGKCRNTDRGGRTRCRSRQPESEWVRVERPDLRIVPEELWLAVQQRRRPAGSNRGPASGYASASLFSSLLRCSLCEGPLTIAGSRAGERCYGCSRHRNRGGSVCTNDLLESVRVVDARLLEEIERMVLTPEARRLVIEAAEGAIKDSLDRVDETATRLKRALAQVSRDIENLLDAVETGAAPAALLKRLRERERERAKIEAQLATVRPARAVTPFDTRRIRRVLDDGLSQLREVLHADTSASRQALHQILADKIRFTPLEMPTGMRTYKFEATLSLGRVVAAIRQNGVDVPDGI